MDIASLRQNVVSAALDMRRTHPLVHNITNYVVMQISANVLLAAGASPLMAHAPEELDDLLSLASALVLNIGTLDQSWLSSMRTAGECAARHGVPVVLDPVGAGASRLRTGASLELLKNAHPAVLRGNASEILAVAAAEGFSHTAAATRGVDSTQGSNEALAAALDLARRHDCVVSVSGERDYITDGEQTVVVSGGSPLMSRITGMGCSASALTAAHVACAASPLIGAVAAMAAMAEAGEEATRDAKGPGSFLSAFLDALYLLEPQRIAPRVSLL